MAKKKPEVSDKAIQYTDNGGKSAEVVLDVETPPPTVSVPLTDDAIITRGEVAGLFVDEHAEPYLFGKLQGLVDNQKRIVLNPRTTIDDVVRAKHHIEAYEVLFASIRDDVRFGRNKMAQRVRGRG